jgi:hypothetical protein
MCHSHLDIYYLTCNLRVNDLIHCVKFRLVGRFDEWHALCYSRRMTTVPKTIKELFDLTQRRPLSTCPKGQKEGDVKRILPFEDQTQRAVLLTSMEKGFPIKTCLESLGITIGTWRKWQRRADYGEEPFASFFHEARISLAKGQIGLLEHIRAAGEGAPDQNGVWRNQWKASAWLLEKADPGQFADVSRVELDAHVVSSTVEVDVDKLSVSELEDLYLLTAKASVAEEGEEDADVDG